jgi:hypothetical protein
MNDVAECVALDGNRLALLYFVIQLHQDFDEAAGHADDVLELVAVKHLLVLRRARRRPAGSASRPSLPSQP